MTNSSSRKRILVTGGAGFIGSNFVYLAAKKKDYAVTALDKLTYAGNKKNISELIKSKEINFIKADIADKKNIFKIFKSGKFDAVVNFAAETHVDRSIVSPSIFVMTNVVGTQNLLEACREFKVKRFHQVSTDEVYGDLGDNSKNFFLESTPLNPTSPYAASKAAADVLVLSYAKTFGLHATISRCSNNYGPYQFPEKLIPFFFQRAVNNQFVPLYGDGKNIRDWLYVTDHCEAIEMIMNKGQPCEIFNIGGNNEKTNMEIARMILKFLNKPLNLIKSVKDRLAHDRRYAIDSTYIKNKLGWQPKTDFNTGIGLTFEWYSNNKKWWQELLIKNKAVKYY